MIRVVTNLLYQYTSTYISAGKCLLCITADSDYPIIYSGKVFHTIIFTSTLHPPAIRYTNSVISNK